MFTGIIKFVVTTFFALFVSAIIIFSFVFVCLWGFVTFVLQTDERDLISQERYVPAEEWKPGYYVSGPYKGESTGYCDVCGRPDQ